MHLKLSYQLKTASDYTITVWGMSLVNREFNFSFCACEPRDFHENHK